MITRGRLEDAGKLAGGFLHGRATGKGAADLTAFLITGAIGVALIRSGRFALRRGAGPWD